MSPARAASMAALRPAGWSARRCCGSPPADRWRPPAGPEFVTRARGLADLAGHPLDMPDRLAHHLTRLSASLRAPWEACAALLALRAISCTVSPFRAPQWPPCRSSCCRPARTAVSSTTRATWPTALRSCSLVLSTSPIRLRRLPMKRLKPRARSPVRRPGFRQATGEIAAATNLTSAPPSPGGSAELQATRPAAR